MFILIVSNTRMMKSIKNEENWKKLRVEVDEESLIKRHFSSFVQELTLLWYGVYSVYGSNH